jgi:hypothetical protein
VPLTYTHRQGQGRWLFRQAVGDLLPPPVRDRHDKQASPADGPLRLVRGRPELLARVAALRDHAGAAALIDLDAVAGHLAGLPGEAALRTGTDHPNLRNRGAVLRALAAADFVAAGARREHHALGR